MSGRDPNTLISYFFKEDGRASVFVKSFFVGDEFRTSPEVNTGSLADDILRASNYDDASAKSYRNEDVHPSFTDFIYNTGLFHKSLDTPMYSGSPVESIVDYINNPSSGRSSADSAVQSLLNACNLSETDKTEVRNGLSGILDIFSGSAKTSAEATVAVSGVNTVVKKFFSGQHDTLAKDAQQTIWRNVYAGWIPDRQTREQNFYRTFITVLQNAGGKWTKVDEKNYSSVQLNENFRLNINKTTGGEPTFASVLPKLPASFKRVFTSDLGLTGSNASQVATATSIRDIYLSAFRNCDQSRVPQLSPSTTFNILSDQLVRERLLRLKTATSIPESKIFDDQILGLDTNSIWRRDADNRLFRVENGQTVLYDDFDINNTRGDYKCYGTGFSGTTSECKTFIDCFTNSDDAALKQCIIDLSKKPFFETAKTEISGTHPLMAQMILKRFGFGTRPEYDETAGMSLNKVESVEHWISGSLMKKFNNEDIKSAFSGAEKVREYLKLLVQYVNSNPAIMNKNYSGKNNESAGRYTPPLYLSKLGIPARQEPSPADDRYYIKQLSNHQRTSAFALGSTVPLISTPGVALGLKTALGVNSPISYSSSTYGAWSPLQTGGGHVNKQSAGAMLIEGVFEGLLRKIKNNGKNLSEADIKQIRTKIDDLKKSESQVAKVLSYIEEYSNLVSTFGTSGATQTLSYDNLRELVNQKNSLDSKKSKDELSLTSILAALTKSADCNSDDENYTPINNIE